MSDAGNNQSNSLGVLIVGCGNIAGGFDQGRADGYLPYTHAGAFTSDSRFSINACIEPDDARREEFMQAWSIPAGFPSFSELPAQTQAYDVVSICSPTQYHAQDIESAIALNPSLIFCEKPVSASLPVTENMVNLCEKAGIPLAINYTRRWDPDVARFKSEMDDGRWGKLRCVNGLYNKGVLNNGSHMIDLLHMLLGPVRIIKVGKAVIDYLDDDPTVAVWLEDQQGVPVHLACAHAQDYAVFELQLVFSHGILTMEDGGLSWRERCVVDSDTFKGYRNLEEGGRRKGEYPQAMLKAVDNIHDVITNSAPLASNGAAALTAHKVCDDILQQVVSR